MAHLDEEDDEEDDFCGDCFHSVRTATGLEIGVQVKWPGVPPFELCTCLSEVEIAPMFHGTQWAGTRVWRAAVVALKYLLCDECPVKLGPESSLIELGCGLGVPGIIVSLIRQCHTVLTDRESLLEQLHGNLNSLSQAQHSSDSTTDTSSNTSTPSSRLQAVALDWSVPGVQNLIKSYPQGFDVVLNCDCIYEPLYGQSWKQLAECQEEFLRQNARTFLLTSVERRLADGIDLYLQRMEESDLVDKVEKIVLPFDAPTEVELYRIVGK